MGFNFDTLLKQVLGKKAVRNTAYSIQSMVDDAMEKLKDNNPNNDDTARALLDRIRTSPVLNALDMGTVNRPQQLAYLLGMPNAALPQRYSKDQKKAMGTANQLALLKLAKGEYDKLPYNQRMTYFNKILETAKQIGLMPKINTDFSKQVDPIYYDKYRGYWGQVNQAYDAYHNYQNLPYTVLNSMLDTAAKLSKLKNDGIDIPNDTFDNILREIEYQRKYTQQHNDFVNNGGINRNYFNATLGYTKRRR